MNETYTLDSLVIDSNPIIKDNIIETQHHINTKEEISISVNNSRILDKTNIKEIKLNIIKLKNNDIKQNDDIAVIYNKL